ncbi:mitogen-activated protein kinase kinase kinase [Thraustotheca clavata]|uniref:Mitogen-activated protein kinase kinase kinase n=1 Tax=Thraustotheca clavata TaxID=74557 RepID=A0A1V9ZJ14_9STRA|nr:mitogen-activated protein kinase kinase kinase [Thraustotheca clavata]
MTSISSKKKWAKKEKIGQGAHGIVYKCTEASPSTRIVAVKELDTKGLSSQEIESLMNEATIMKELNHKHIIQYFGVKEKKRKHVVQLAMEFMPGGSLSAYIRAVGGALTIERTKQYTWQLLSALQYLHEHRLAHRDIKSANVLLSMDQSQLKLADFGALKEIGSVSVVGGLKGTPHWMAPEVIKEQQTSDGWIKADIWSLGCTVLEMLTGKTPWQQFSNPLTAMYKIVSSESIPEVPLDLPSDAIEFLHSCFQREPNKRPNAKQLLRSSFLKSIRKEKKKERNNASPARTSSTISEVRKVKNKSPPKQENATPPKQRASPESDDDIPMPKSKILSIIYSEMLPPSPTLRLKAKKMVKLVPLTGTRDTNQEEKNASPRPTTSKLLESIQLSSPKSNGLYSPRSPQVSSPLSSPHSPAPLLSAKSLGDIHLPFMLKKPELRRVATAPSVTKRSDRRADSTIKEATKGALSATNRGTNESSNRPATQPESKVRKAKDETIVIHVCDEFRNINRDFTCNKTLLLENMRYFKGYLNEENANEDIDISVHCDVGIFEWLYSFIHASPTKPKLAIDNVTSILISSEFLQMDYLVNECTTFIGQNLESVVDMPGDLLSVSEVILESIAVKCSLEQLDVIEPRKEKLCHKLYSKRLARLIATLKHTDKGLELCSFCGVVFYKGHRPFLTCSQATPSIGRHGEVLLMHNPKPEWKSDAWIKSLGTSNPRHTFWKLWGALQCLYCTNCQNFFTSSEIKECLHHPSNLADATIYDCCGAPKFAADSRVTRGCKSQHHALGRSIDLRSHYDSTLDLDQIHELTLNHIDIIARDKPPIPSPVSNSNVHEMLRCSVCAPKSMLENVDVPSDVIKSIKSNNADVSTPQTRKQWKIDLYTPVLLFILKLRVDFKREIVYVYNCCHQA